MVLTSSSSNLRRPLSLKLPDHFFMFRPCKLVSLAGDYWSLDKILSRRRRRRLPFESRQSPRIRFRDAAITHRPNQIDQRDQQTDSQYRRPRGGQNMQHLPRNQIRRICVIASRHPHVTQNKLWRERQIESHKNNQSRKAPPTFG